MKKLGYLGPQGTFCEQAAGIINLELKYELVPLDAIFECIREVGRGHVDGAVVPIENSLEGSVSVTLDELVFGNQDVEIVAEIALPIEHHLVVLPGTQTNQITDIFSHPQALSQCRLFLEKNFPKAVTHQASSTARSVHLISRADNAGHSAAIASRQAAEINKCEILLENVADNTKNTTRFIYIAKGKGKQGKSNKTTVIFTLDKDRPGGLHDVLGELSSRQINLTKIESRPDKMTMGGYIFFVDLQGFREEPKMKEALAAVEKKAQSFKVLGSYPVINIEGA